MTIASLKRYAKLAVVLGAMHFTSAAYAADAYLEITLKVDDADRANAAAVYTKYKQPFLDTIPGATSKELLIRTDDVQVLHGFSSEAEARQYLTSELFTKDVVGGLSPYLKADPEIRIYKTM